MTLSKIKSFRLKKEFVVFALIFIVGIFLRSYKPLAWFMYGHDHDLTAWIAQDVVGGHLRLIGQETSSKGVFIGPLFYYLTIPFYVLGNWDPAATVVLPIIISAFGIWSIYFIFNKLFSKNVALVGTLVYALSYLIIFTDREVVPTMPVMIWTVWFFYFVIELLRGKQKSYIFFGLLGGLIWHLNLALALLAPIILLAQIFSKKKINFKYLLLGALFFIGLMTPFFVFEGKHGFQQIEALTSSFTGSKDYVAGTGTGFAKLDRVFQLIYKNTTTLFWGLSINVPARLTFFVLVGGLVLLLAKKIISWSEAGIFIAWQILFVIFFTLNSINPSEYYLNGMNIIWITVFSLTISYLLSLKIGKGVAVVILVLFSIFNLYAFANRPTDESGYLQRKAVAQFISEDAKKHNYPCVSVSYITKPGYNFGYRQFFRMQNLHVNQPKSLSPVYTIVFPHSMVDRLDKTFGSLGLVLPDYARYNEEQVQASCSGENENLTDSMFGFTK